MPKESQHCEASPRGKVWRVITMAFITSCMVDCILYCSGTGRPIHLHWLSYSRRLCGSGVKYQHEMSGWFGWPFTFLRIAVAIVVSLLPCPILSNGIVKIPQVIFFFLQREKVCWLAFNLQTKSYAQNTIHLSLFEALLGDAVVIVKWSVKWFLESDLVMWCLYSSISV